MKKLLFLAALMLLVGCTALDGLNISPGDFDELIVCDPPYIRHGSDCCLDTNDNGICDSDESLSLEGVTCNPPYIIYGEGCCLDVNNNRICDSDETGDLIEGAECDPPYRPHGTGCCLDVNANNICDSDEVTEATNVTTPVCNPPYIPYADDCCLDTNANSICDSDEVVEAVNETITGPYCGDLECNVTENSSNTCCTDCGCESGYYCSDDDTCVESLTFTTIAPITVELFSVCGDDVCSSTENSTDSCCTDCGCDSGYYCSNNTCIEGTPPLFFPIYIPMTAYIPSTDQIISNSSGAAVGGPRIYGNKVVFHQYFSSEPRIMSYDTITGVLTQIPYEERSFDPDITGGKMVWYDYGRSLSDNSDIYYYDFAGGVQGYISPRHTYQRTPLIDGNAIVWYEWDDSVSIAGAQVLYMYWIPSGEERRIFAHDDETLVGGGYAIWGGDIVYATFDCTSGVPCPYDLWNYDIATDSTAKLLTVGDKQITHVDIWDEKIAYIVGEGSSHDIYIYNKDTHLTNKLTTGIGEKMGISIYEDMVVWADERNGNWDIYMYDMATSTETQISSDSQDETRPDIYYEYIVYKRGNMDIVLHEIT